jgi:hypothetical protein
MSRKILFPQAFDTVVGMRWQDAENRCLRENAQLASIHSWTENMFLRGIVSLKIVLHFNIWIEFRFSKYNAFYYRSHQRTRQSVAQ